MIENLVHAYRKALKEEIAQWVTETGVGAAADWDDYKRRVGVVAGLNRAMVRFDDLIKKSGDVDDDSADS